MAHLKLTIDDFYSNDFELIAIHTTIEDYKLAYLINRILELSLSKNQKDICIQSNNETGFFSWFYFDDDKHDLIWNLVANKTVVAKSNTSIGLFDEDNVTFHLIPELKKADYLLKIENLDDHFNTQLVVNKIIEINQVSTCYIADVDAIKSINNLIF